MARTWRAPSRTSAPSSGCMNRWASTPAAWACSRATTARPRRTCAAVRGRGPAVPPWLLRQTIDADGHQEHAYPDYDPSRLPILRVTDRDGEPLTVPVELPGRTVHVAVWKVQVGPRAAAAAGHGYAPQRGPGPAHHAHPVRAWSGDAPPPGAGAGRRWRARAAGAGRPARCVAPQRGPLRVHARGAGAGARRGRALDVDEALARVRSGAVFTIHTPVSAGNERFDAELVRRVAEPHHRGHAAVTMDRMLEIGRGADGDAIPSST